MKNYNDSFTHCRTLGHSWDVVSAKGVYQAPDEVALELRCDVCGMERTDRVTKRSGELLRRRYSQPVGYKFDRLSRSEWRTSFLSSLKGKT